MIEVAKVIVAVIFFTFMLLWASSPRGGPGDY